MIIVDQREYFGEFDEERPISFRGDPVVKIGLIGLLRQYVQKVNEYDNDPNQGICEDVEINVLHQMEDFGFPIWFQYAASRVASDIDWYAADSRIGMAPKLDGFLSCMERLPVGVSLDAYAPTYFLALTEYVGRECLFAARMVDKPTSHNTKTLYAKTIELVKEFGLLCFKIVHLIADYSTTKNVNKLHGDMLIKCLDLSKTATSLSKAVSQMSLGAIVTDVDRFNSDVLIQLNDFLWDLSIKDKFKENLTLNIMGDDWISLVSAVHNLLCFSLNLSPRKEDIAPAHAIIHALQMTLSDASVSG